MDFNTQVKKLKADILNCNKVVFLTGAGISAESGVPTFRGPGGMWKNHNPEYLATPQAFRRDPHLVWEWYQYRRDLIAKCKPNSGHVALAEFERDLKAAAKDFTLITQNVDGLHRDAGTENIIEMHGSIRHVRCFGEGPEKNYLCDDVGDLPPKCTNCDEYLRPGVVWFGEAIPESALLGIDKAMRGCDLFFVIGTSAVVYPAASFAMIAKQNGAKVVQVNLEKNHLSGSLDYEFYGKSGEILPKILQ